MKLDPVLRELYATKEAFAAKYNYDLHALAESFRRSPTWKPVKRPARSLRTAEERIKRLTEENKILKELRQVRRELLAEAGDDLRKVLERADREAPKLLAKYRKPTKGKFRSVKPKSELRA